MHSNSVLVEWTWEWECVPKVTVCFNHFQRLAPKNSLFNATIHFLLTQPLRIENVNKVSVLFCLSPRPCHLRTPGRFNKCVLFFDMWAPQRIEKEECFNAFFPGFCRPPGSQKGKTRIWIFIWSFWLWKLELICLWNSVKFRVRCVF